MENDALEYPIEEGKFARYSSILGKSAFFCALGALFILLIVYFPSENLIFLQTMVYLFNLLGIVSILAFIATVVSVIVSFSKNEENRKGAMKGIYWGIGTTLLYLTYFFVFLIFKVMG